MRSEKLTALGWKWFYDCTSCPNNPQAYYSHTDHPGYTIRFAIRSKTFRIMKENRTVGGPYFEYQAEDKLKNFTWL